MSGLSQMIENSALFPVINASKPVGQVQYRSREISKPLGVSTITLKLQKVPYKVCILQDQSLYAELEKEKVAKEYMKKFFAMITHELRNPLQGVLGIFETLLEISNVDPGQCKMGISTVKLMMRLVNDLLDLSQMETEKFKLASEEVNIVELVQECMELMQFKYQTKGVDLVHINESSIPRFKCDKNRYKQILLNLLGNAIKFTDKGQVIIKTNYDSELRKMFTTVKDTGVGIKDEDKEKLFSFFGKLEDQAMVNPQGAGLGLYICKKLTEAMGGRIALKSEYMQGTTITFSVENKAEAETPQISFASIPDLDEEDFSSDMEESPHPPFKKPYSFTLKTVPNTATAIRDHVQALVVDDEFICAGVLQAYLKGCGINSETVCLYRYINYRHLQECRPQIQLRRNQITAWKVTD
eukprot:TRINITY_DN3759_c0_g1_i1.p1 TRINITY_DN3759_c0_g1~~TRINITY_DN3759_c0_g1_i1.p1  ORF type:complete len:412 (+),score=56.79 TRINITY_DN3759_c0_g1_i1:1098-2333(+)